MEERNTLATRAFGLAVLVLLVGIPAWVIWAFTESVWATLATAGIVTLLAWITDWGGGRGLAKQLRTRPREESAPYDEPPDRPLSRWQ